MSSNRRMIAVYYFTNSQRSHVLSGTTRWYKYARKASQAAHDAILHDLYGAAIAVVYDDTTGKDLYIYSRDVNGEVKTAYTAEALKPKNLGTPNDPFATFARKLTKSRAARQAKNFDLVRKSHQAVH